MNAIDVVKASLAAVEAGRTKKYEESLSDDILFAGPYHNPSANASSLPFNQPWLSLCRTGSLTSGILNKWAIR